MSKDPTPKADKLRAQREARYGHIQATAAANLQENLAAWASPRSIVARADPPPTPTPNEAALLAVVKRKAPYAGKPPGDTVRRGHQNNKKPESEKKPPRKRVKRKRRTELPPEGKTP